MRRSGSSSQTSDEDRAEKQGGLAALGVPLDLEPMEAKLVSELPKDAGWQYEPKWDGFRRLAFRAGDEVEIKAKSGKSLSRFFPEVLENLLALAAKTFVLDGEHPSQGRTFLRCAANAATPRREPDHPAFETPATFVVFDCRLRKAGQSLLPKTFEGETFGDDAVSPRPAGRLAIFWPCGVRR
jgi:ATP-dependent DNA ligase